MDDRVRVEEVKRSVFGPFISSGYEILVDNTGFYNGTENIMAGTVSTSSHLLKYDQITLI